MKTDCSDFRQLPGQNPLFLAYLYEFDRVQDLYTAYPRSRNEWEQRVEQVVRRKHFSRSRLVALLRTLNEEGECGSETLRNLERLESSSCVAVVTGQQVGLFGGPSYSVYKAATALKIVRFLRDLGYEAVPIFWMAADDSDFDEIRSTYFLGSDAEIFGFSHTDSRPRDQRMAGAAALEEEVRSMLDDLSQRLQGPHRPEVNGVLSQAYQPGRSFRQAFAVWLHQVFRDYGLIVFDPLSAGYRRDLAGFYAPAIERREELVAAVQNRNQLLSSRGFQPQVHIDPAESFLFWIEGESRFKLEADKEGYRVKGRRSMRFQKKELLDGLESGKLVLSPNVLLRPLLQDHLFPTVVGVAGPSEIAYYSQVNVLAPCWDLEMEVVPRAGFTVVDRKSRRLLNKHHLDPCGVISENSHRLAERILRTEAAGSVLANFDSLKSTLGPQLDSLRNRLAAEDPTVAAMLSNAEKKIFYQLDKVQHRFVSNRHQRRSPLESQLRHLKNHLVPRDHLQERVVNFNYFLAEEGLGFLDAVVELIQPFSACHRLLYL